MNDVGRGAPFWALIGILCAEALLVAGLAIVLVVELLVDRPASLPSALALTVLTALAAVWLVVIIVHALRGRAWIRGAAIVWQVLQFSVGLGALQGLFAQPAWGWPLLLVALAGFGLLLSPPVVRATSRRES
ncbi:hypothetical protein [Homoserinibacter sp. YIM 151385]|uniref:hypothetical protein n=1 Tax=Homoserinibacter sp. YIM 151385 TaxID=2985506 RepID=UPI0022F0C6B0|nr:hypothetical protein [Homoserinibacter sp. YIM 151385]WBU37824.1 hypothetical protein OF852_13025 [Homoserinibacter sp. YIM 151385]